MRAVDFSKGGSADKRILAAMAVSPQVCGPVCARWPKEGGLFRSDWANTVGGWVAKYWRKHRKPPGKDIAMLYEAWMDDRPDPDLASAVKRFLDGMEGHWYRHAKEVNADAVLDLAGSHFNKVLAERLVEAMQGHLENGDVAKALECKEKSRRLELGEGGWVDVLGDDGAITKAFDDKQEPLIRIDGDAGLFFEDFLERDGFIAVMSPEKRGKSFWLQELAWQGMLQDRRIAMFQVGDLSQSQAMRRLMVRASKRPLRACEAVWPTAIAVEDGEVEVEQQSKTWSKALAKDEAWACCQKVMKKHGGMMRLATYANSSISAAGVDSALDRWSLDGWEADVVVIDYVDILAPLWSKAENSRDQINETWKYLRRMSQQRHCLVLTATQSDADSYSTDLIRKRNFSEDKRKYAHVTGMFALNQTDREKELGVYRLNWPVTRDGTWSENEVVWVGGSLALANPLMVSVLGT